MVQREVADRFFASPSTKAYGAVSVLVQLAARRTGFHPVARTVFRPPPNVDSALVAFRRTQLPDDFARLEAVVEAAFAHRRKTLPELARARRPRRPRAGRRRARSDRPSGRDAGRGARARRVRRPRAGAVKRAPAPAKINLALVVGPARDDGKHEVATVLQRVDLGDRVAIAPALRLEVDGFAADTLVRDALDRARASRRSRAALARDDREADPGRRRSRRRQLGRRHRAAARQRDARRTAPAAPSSPPSRRRSAPTFRSSSTHGPQLGRGDGSELEPLDLPQDYWILLALPSGAGKESTASVYRDFDERNGAAGWDERRQALELALAGVRRPRDLAALPPNDLASSPLAGRAPGPRSVPRRRDRCRPRRLRPLPPPPPRGGGATRRSAALPAHG